MALTFHHLIPKKLHRRVHYRRHYTRDELALGIHICRDCHNGIHRFYDEMHLAKYLNTSESLAADTQLKRHFAWVARQRVR